MAKKLFTEANLIKELRKYAATIRGIYGPSRIANSCEEAADDIEENQLPLKGKSIHEIAFIAALAYGDVWATALFYEDEAMQNKAIRIQKALDFIQEVTENDK